MAIMAFVHSDDHNIEIGFNATAWFNGATDDELLELADCGFRSDYATDAIADWFCEGATKPLFDYLYAVANTRAAQGFECSVDENQAVSWIETYRPYLFRENCVRFGWDVDHKHTWSRATERDAIEHCICGAER